MRINKRDKIRLTADNIRQKLAIHPKTEHKLPDKSEKDHTNWQNSLIITIAWDKRDRNNKKNKEQGLKAQDKE